MKASRLIPLLLLVAGLVPVAAAPAHAHADVSGTTPSSGQQLETAPGDITLTFTGPVVALGTRVQVIGPQGEATGGRPVIGGTTVRQPLKSGLGDGTYIVNWRAVTSEGHPLGGTYTFGIGTADAAPAGQPSAAPTTTPTPSTAPSPVPVAGHGHTGAPAPSGEDANGIAGVAYVLGIVALAGILALAVLFERRRGRR